MAHEGVYLLLNPYGEIEMKKLTKFLIYVNSIKDSDRTLTNRIADIIREKGGTVSVASGDQDTKGGSVRSDLIEDKEAVIVLGGDGTMLRAAHTTSKYKLPLTGINLGTVGFLAETDFSRAGELIDRLMSGDYKMIEKMVLKGSISRMDSKITEADQNSDDKERSESADNTSSDIEENSYTAINDIVIYRDGKLRIIMLNIFVNGQFFETYKADGVIISTPTGSTAYNLSAGGPLVSPMARNIILTPIAPHSLTGKSFVFADTDRISIEVVEKSKNEGSSALVSYDGYKDVSMTESCKCDISVMDETVKFISVSDRNFYDVLRSKLGS